MAGLAGGDDCLGRAASALRVGAVGIEPKAQRDPDRSRARAQQRDRAVDAAAHRDRDAPGRGSRAKHGSDRVRQRVGGQRLATDGGRLEKGEPNEGPLEPRRVGLDDALAVDREPDERELARAGGVSEDLDHALRLAP